MKNPIKNLADVEDYNYSEECPEHMNYILAEYDFGQNDATVTVYHNCNCAVISRDWPRPSLYCTTYSEAEGIARMQASINAKKYQ